MLGFRSFGANISRPLDLQLAEFTAGSEYLTDEEQQQKEIEAQKKKDTDQDGLSDYDELYVYKTSPYLTDSDSDGFDDKTETFSNNDPNCPTGKTCGAASEGKEETVNNTSALLQSLLGSFVNEEQLLESGQVKFETAEDVEAFFKKLTIQEIRNALLEAGMSKEVLDQIDDETLEAYFSGAIDTASEAGGFDELVQPSSESTTETSIETESQETSIEE